MKMRITVEGKTYEVDVEMLEDETGARVTSTRRAEPPRPAPSEPSPSPAPGPARAPSAAPATADEGKTVKSPIAGMVQSITIKAGDDVRVNDTLLVLEAMKMESSVASPIAGTVKKVHAEAGQAVRMGDILVEFE